MANRAGSVVNTVDLGWKTWDLVIVQGNFVILGGELFTAMSHLLLQELILKLQRKSDGFIVVCTYVHTAFSVKVLLSPDSVSIFRSNVLPQVALSPVSQKR